MGSRKQAKERDKKRKLQEEQKKAADKNKAAKIAPSLPKSDNVEIEAPPECPIIIGWGAHIVMAMIFMPLFRRRGGNRSDD